MKNGQLVNSITETIAPKPKPIVQDGEEPKQAAALNQDRTSLISDKAFSDRAAFDPINRWACLTNMRTCNCCVQGSCNQMEIESVEQSVDIFVARVP